VKSLGRLQGNDAAGACGVPTGDAVGVGHGECALRVGR
jgi:hypothetical protein